MKTENECAETDLGLDVDVTGRGSAGRGVQRVFDPLGGLSRPP